MKKKRIVALIAAFAVIVAGFFTWRSCSSSDDFLPMAQTVPLARQELVKSVSVTGTVESQQVEKIYAGLNYPVQELRVKVGDSVSAGDVLCVLDTAELENTIAQQRATISSMQQSNSQNVSSAQRQYNSAKDAMEREYDQQVKAAEQAVMQAEATLERAGIDVRQARADLQNGRDDDVDDDEIAQLKRLNQKAAVDYDTAKANLEYAKLALQNTKRDVNQQLADYQDAVAKAQVSNTSLQAEYLAVQQMERNLEKATVTAPARGTVTAVYADEGAASTGLMFVIEDTGSLLVRTKIKEYDIADIRVGNRVEIKSDATGDEVFEGVVSRIAPTSMKDASGDSADTTDAEFETEITVTDRSASLRIGTTARLMIVVEEKQDVFVLPYEAITYDMEGNDAVYVPDYQEDGSILLRTVIVETGLESDFSVEIQSDELQEGDLVLSSTIGMMEGMAVMLPEVPAPEDEEGEDPAGEESGPEGEPAAEEGSSDDGEAGASEETSDEEMDASGGEDGEAQQ